MKTRVEKIDMAIQIDKTVGKNHLHVEFERFNPQTHVWNWRVYRPTQASLIRFIRATS